MTRLPSRYRRRSRSRSPSKGRRRSRSRSRSPSKARHRSRSPPASKVRRRSRSPSLTKVRCRSRSPPPSKVLRRSRSPPYDTTQRLVELQRAKRPSADAAFDGREEEDMSGQSPLDEALMERRPSRSHCSCKHSETLSAAMEKTPDPTIQGDEQELHSEKMHAKNQSDHKAPSRNARRKKMKRQVRTEAKKQMREMEKDKLLDKIKKLQDCVWLLEKNGADKAEIMEFRSLLESTKKQYEENEELLAHAGSSASKQVLNSDRFEKTHVETMAAPVEKVEVDEQNMDSREAEGTSLKGCQMTKDKLLEKIKKLQDCVWLLEKDGADSDEIREFRSLLESTKKQYEENEELLAQAGSTASQQHVETMTAHVEKVERDEQNMDSGEAEGRSLKGCEAVSEQNDLAEEVDRLKSEIETVRQDRDYQSAQVQSLIADMAKQKEVVRRYGAELEDVMRRVAGLEEGGLLQSEMIRTLQVQLASANEKLTVPSSTRD